MTFVVREGDKCHYVEEDAVWVMPMLILACCTRLTAEHSSRVWPWCRGGRLNAIAAIGAYWATQHEPTESEVEMRQAMADSAALALGV